MWNFRYPELEPSHLEDFFVYAHALHAKEADLHNKETSAP